MRRELTMTLFLFALGCQATEPDLGLPPGLAAQMDESLRRAQYTQGAARLGELRKLSAFGPHATEGVTRDLLHHANPQIRSNAIFVLGEIYRLDGDERALEAVKSAMNDGDALVRLEAARALLETGDWNGIEPLVTALDASNRGTRARAFLALRDAAGSDFGYHPDSDETRRREAMARFRDHFAKLAH